MDEPGFERSVAVSNVPVEATNTAEAAPDFTLQSLQGETFKLSELRGKTVILNFWTSWCPPCHEEIPELEKFQADYIKDHPDVVLLGVNLTQEDHGEEKIKSFVNANQMTFPVLLDTEGNAARAYSILTIPSTYVVDGQGNIKKKILGPVTKEQLITEVER